MLVDYKSDSGLYHWRKFVKNIGWANQNIGGQKVIKVIDAWAFLNYWVHMPWLPSQSLRLWYIDGSGFRKGHSTETFLCCLLSYMYGAIDRLHTFLLTYLWHCLMSVPLRLSQPWYSP